MATTEKSPKEPRKTSEDQNEQSTVDNLEEALAKTELQEDDSSLAATEQVAAQSARPLHVYKRPELLFLSKSPLVKPPDGLPPLKEWFGDWNEQVGSKKETESSGSATNARERRFRPRDAEEGEGQARPSFRSSLSQPSQMGNFRHQSLRTTERERDRDTERERQRDERDREGQERLRNLSDKYDRDRLAASSNSTLRGKERDPAPHLTSGSSARRSQEQNGASTRRTDARDAGRKKAGETSDDWRRAPDTGRTLRDDKTDTARKDRDRPRSRVRDSSRSRRDPSPGRRDKEDRPRRTEDRDDDYRRDREDYFPRRDWDDAPRDRDRDDRYRERERFDRSSRDVDRDTDDDPRRWRDDGRRDERQATRRERDRGDRNWDRWELSHDRERVDDRDGRSKRAGGRDRRPGALDDLKEKDERKEKEPAWMETYVPSSPGAGILGGKGADGELDGIQAWKKGMKEREKKDKDIETPPEARRKSTTPPEVRETAAPTGEPPLDEIQMFKLMMKKEAAKKESDTLEPETPQTIPGGQAQAVKDGSNTQASVPEAVPQPSDNPGTSATSNDGARLLSLLAQGSTSSDPAVLVQPPKATAPVESSSSDIPVAVSRLFPPPTVQAPDRGAIDLSSPAVPPNQFNPPAGSRLLAFAARSAPTNVPTNKPTHPSDILMNPLTPSGMIPSKLGGMTPPPPGIGINALHQGPDAFNSLQSEPHLIVNPRATPSDRSGRSYSPFNHASRQVNAADEIPDGVRLSHVDPLGRPIIAPHPEHGVFGSNSDISSPYGEQGGSPNFPLSPNFEHGGNVAGGGSSVGRGSRFAKFFDAKNRESQANLGPRRTPVQPGLVPTPPLPGHNGINQSVAEHRAMEDLFAMLQSSTQQQHRASPQLQQTNRIPSGGGLYGQGPIDIQALHHQQQFVQQNARLDSLYDSRLDDRNFVPDGLVPGLRPAPRPRSREPTGVLFNEQLDDPLHFNAQRIQQQRHLEQLYPGQAPPFNQPALGRGGITLQQAQLRELQMREAQIREAQLREVQLREAQLREAAALREAQIREAQLRNQQGPQQRLPPGLANLGARPPHDPAQYINSQLGTPGGLLQSLQQGGPAQQRFDGFGGSFNGPSVARGPVPGPHHQNSAINQLNGLGPANELRNPIGLGGASLGGNPRGLGPGFPQQQHLQAQLALRQQQQQHIPPQVLQHSLAPPHVQHQQQNIHVGNTQGTADLMALLMGGQRE